jgi:hypothetical protein
VDFCVTKLYLGRSQPLEGIVNLKAFLAIPLLALTLTSFAQADLAIPKDKWIVIHALQDALRAANFSDCRVDISGAQISLLHGVFERNLDLTDARTKITIVGNIISIKGDESDGESWYSNKFDFILTFDQKNINAVHFFRSRFDRVNVGTITNPIFKQIETPINKISCKAD